MKKIFAFLTAFVLLICSVVVVDRILPKKVAYKDHNISYWNSIHKDISYNAISQNLNNNTLLVLGSSEFQHAMDSPYHPKNLFGSNQLNIYTAGHGPMECISHDLVLGSISNKLKSKKVVYLLSFQWFRPLGSVSNSYFSTFNTLSYIKLMENKLLKSSTKRYISKRSHELLRNHYGTILDLNLIDRINHVFGKPSKADYKLYKALKAFRNDQDIFSTHADAFRSRYNPNAQVLPSVPISEWNWNNIMEDALKAESGKHFAKRFYMSTDKWNKKYNKKRLKRFHNSAIDENLTKSRTYRDYQAFLKICKESHIKAKIILIPFNGGWYRYNGLSKHQIDAFRAKIKALTKRYHCQMTDMSYLNDDKNFFEDASHPTGYGWLKICKEIYDFYNKD